jgi:hypothetical protein
MSDCCSKSDEVSSPKRHICPENGQEYLQVPYSTVLQHIKKPWDQKSKQQREKAYYFCSDPDCEVVYFDGNSSIIKKSELRTLVGVKEPKNDNAMACYCFDITLAEAKNDAKLKKYVIDQTKNNFCSCESHNPSGKCCLKDFPKSK